MFKVYAIALLQLLFISTISIAISEEESRSHVVSPVAIAPSLLESEIIARLERVEEFVAIRKMAERRGRRVWLFGGSAAGFAHYVRWDLLREQGDTRFQADRFDYDFMSIYRFSQDADIVIDGNARQVAKFQKELKNEFPYFKGKKTRWEVRSLYRAVGENEALLGNTDFLKQHSDSNSIGMIELTRTQEPAIRDIRNWDSLQSQFLEDISMGRIRYYHSSLHEETRRARDGKNPPILSVVRYLIKAFQYGLTLDPNDGVIIRKVIQEYDPAIQQSSYTRYWFENNGHKLFRNALDVAYAWNTLESLGLRQKLLRLEGVAFWANKEPLRDRNDPNRPALVRRADLLREGIAGETAAALGITVVTHETSDYSAYESIRSSPQGVPNVFISREGADLEAASYGSGFYTRIGLSGARETGFQIRMQVDPSALEGVDFVMNASGEYVIWLTRDKLSVKPESFYFNPREALPFIVDPRNASEQGLVENMLRKWNRWETRGVPNPEEREAIHAIVERTLEKLIRNAETDSPRVEKIFVSKYFVESPLWQEWVETLLNRGLRNQALYQLILSDSRAKNHPSYPRWIDKLIDQKVLPSKEKCELLLLDVLRP